MRAVVQRANNADVKVDGKIVGEINGGLLVFLGIGNEDDEVDLNYLVDKVIGLRIFEDEQNKMNLSLLDIGGELLVVSQFTLYGDVRKGKRPNFTQSAPPKEAEKMYMDFIKKCREYDIRVEEGIFGAHMIVNIQNDGPVTILLDSKKTF